MKILDSASQVNNLNNYVALLVPQDHTEISNGLGTKKSNCSLFFCRPYWAAALNYIYTLYLCSHRIPFKNPLKLSQIQR